MIDLVCIRDAIFLLTMVTPYMLYTWAFKAPENFKKHLSQNALVLISSLIHGTTFVTYFWICLASGLNKPGLCFGLPMIAVGQLLNYLVYQKLGQVRAYYGWELNLDNNPPQQGFPFTLGDAQYKGCMLTVVGFYFCFNANVELSLVTGAWVFMYFYMILMENSKCGRVVENDKKQN